MATYGPDYYHGNFANDGPVPVDRVAATPDVTFCILKYTQGGSYPDWAGPQGPRVRGAGLILGGYHMLDGDSATSGADQAKFFLSRYKPQPGDIVPIVDYEGVGQGSASLSSYKSRLIDFIKAVHAAGFEVMLYGHATVKASFSDWRDSGADYWWVPGDQPWSDVGPRGPDLWQYSPYTSPAGYPTNPAGNPREDVSRVITALPLVPGGDDMTGDELLKGVSAYLQNGPAPADGPALKMYRALQQKEGGTSGLTKNQADVLYAAKPHAHDVTGKAK